MAVEETRVTFRLPEDVYRAALDLSKQEVRSLNGELIILLREGLRAHRQTALLHIDAPADIHQEVAA